MKKPPNNRWLQRKNKKTRLLRIFSVLLPERFGHLTKQTATLHLRHSCEILQSPSTLGLRRYAPHSESFNGFMV